MLEQLQKALVRLPQMGLAEGTQRVKGSGGPLMLGFGDRLSLQFHEAKITSGAGLMAFREPDKAPGLTEMASTCLQNVSS